MVKIINHSVRWSAAVMTGAAICVTLTGTGVASADSETPQASQLAPDTRFDAEWIDIMKFV